MNLEMVLLYLSFNEYRKILEDILEKKKSISFKQNETLKKIAQG